MGKLLHQSLSIVLKPFFWVVVILLVLITLPQYLVAQPTPNFVIDLLTYIGLTRHALERILYLIPILLAGLFFGWKGSCITSFIALVLMLPRDLYLSPFRIDALFETGAIFVIGIMSSAIFSLFHRERKERIKLEEVHQNLKQSEERFRQLFENTNDAIIIHDIEGNMIWDANRACTILMGYGKDELLHMKMADLFYEDSWLFLGAVQRLILAGEEPNNTIEARLIKKSKLEIFVNVSMNIIRDGTRSVGFQCILRDINEQKRMQENIQYYLRQATRAQEEERKRISLELHDETVQDLIVLSRQLENLDSKNKELSMDSKQLLTDIRQQTKVIIQSLRHISQDLRPAALDRLGLLPALGHLASEMTKRSGITTVVNVEGVERRLTEETELTLFRITQEALTNVWKHSSATNARITLEFGENGLKMTIRDDGKGFLTTEMRNSLAKEGKLGLVGMQERAKLINGLLFLQSEPGKGTCISIEVPK
jgi:two-component system, NarL family, sensor histidine kinase DegS